MRKLHVAITPDGNRRYARKHDLSYPQAYEKGFEKSRQVLEWASENKVKEVTLWALSLENFFKRSSFEKRIIFGLMKKNAEEMLESRELEDKNIKVRFFGKLELLPKSLYNILRKLEQNSDENKHKFNVGIAYGGRDEILNAAKLVALDFRAGKISEKNLNENSFANYLYLKDFPDLVIRTGGYTRLSGFLPFQTAYSEFYFSKKLWPEFERRDFLNAIDYFHSIERNFGK